MATSTITNNSTGRQRATGAWLVPVLTLCTFVTMLHTVVIGPLMPEIAADLNTNVALLGQIPALTMLLAAGLGLIAGPLADRFGHNRALVFGLLTIVLSAAGMALAPAFLLLLVASLVGAIGRAMVQPVATAIASARFTGTEQHRAISWVSAGIMGAFMAGVPLITTISSVFGWRMALVTLAGITLVLIPLFVSNAGSSTSSQPSSQGKPPSSLLWSAYTPILRHTPTLGLIAACLLGHAAAFMMTTYLGAFAVEQHGDTTEGVGWLYAAFGGALLAGSLAAGGRINGAPLRPLLVFLRGVAGLAMMAMFALPIPLGASVALLVATGIAIGLTHVVMVLLLVQESPAGRATTLTLQTATLSLGIALGNSIGGAVLSVSGFTLLGLCALVFSLASALIVWVTRAQPARIMPVAAG